ncbi:CotD family spore coat protein [Virgibacillus sp. FSP13]
MRHQHGPHCGCPKQIVHPVKHNCVHHCTESVVEHVHPSHTTVMNHHLVKNKHVFPHSTSIQNTEDCVDEYGGSFNYPPQTSPGFGPGNQVAGAMSPGNFGMEQGNNQIAGAMNHGNPSMGHCGQPPMGMDNWKKPNKWC